MSEEITKDLTADEKLDLLIAEMQRANSRLAAIEAFVDDRSRDTRPKLNLIHKELADAREEIRDVKDRVARVDRKFDVVLSDFTELRAAQRDVENRVWAIERKSA